VARAELALSASRINAEELCARYASKVSRFAAFAAKSSSEAEDIAQDALVKAISRLDRFDETRGSMDAWLWRIVVNTARDASRRERVRAAVLERLGARAQPHAAVEDAVIEKLNAAEILAAIRELAPRDRELLALRFGADLDTAAVGAAVGLSAESARRAIGRALDRARALIGAGR
jgi:RNA polymerase sigma-70 factor (ECF subfamily)